jgi:hypothetical protein
MVILPDEPLSTLPVARLIFPELWENDLGIVNKVIHPPVALAPADMPADM